MTLRLTDEESEALRRKAAEEGRSMQEVARTAISRYTQDAETRFREVVQAVSSTVTVSCSTAWLGDGPPVDRGRGRRRPPRGGGGRGRR